MTSDSASRASAAESGQVYPPDTNATHIVPRSSIPLSTGKDAHLPDLALRSTVNFACVALDALVCYTANVATTRGHFAHDLKQPPPAPDPPTGAAPITATVTAKPSRLPQIAHRHSVAATALARRLSGNAATGPAANRRAHPAHRRRVELEPSLHPRCAAHLEAAPRLLPRRPRPSRPL